VLRDYRMIEVPEDPALRAELEERSADELAAMLRGLKPEQHNTSDLLERSRTIRAIEIALHEQRHAGGHEPPTELRSLTIGIRWERSELRRRITERLRLRLENGMIEEVQRLYEGGVAWERLDYYGLEYRYIGAYLQGKMNRNDMFQKLNSAIHDFAKRQENWFRKMEKNGVAINWVEGAGEPLKEALAVISPSCAGQSPV
jgi:tRNA dimethylallyltransferase